MEPYTPKVPEKARTITYYVGLITASLVVLVAGAAFIFLDQETAMKVAAFAGLVGSSFAGFASGMGVAYNPIKHPTTKAQFDQ